MTSGLSLGKKLQEISKALPCQNSLSALTYAGSNPGSAKESLSFEFDKNLSSVETQK